MIIKTEKDGDRRIQKNAMEYIMSDFSVENLGEKLKRIVFRLYDKGFHTWEAAEANYEDDYPRLYIVLNDIFHLHYLVFELSDEFDIQITLQHDLKEDAVMIIERNFNKDKYTKEEFDKKQEELLEELDIWSSSILGKKELEP